MKMGYFGSMPSIHFLPLKKSIEPDGRRTLLELARELGLPLPTACGGKKICGKCRVIIEKTRSLCRRLRNGNGRPWGNGFVRATGWLARLFCPDQAGCASPKKA